MSTILGGICASLIMQSIAWFAKKMGLHDELIQLIVALFVIVSAGLLLITAYFGLKAFLMVYFGVEIKWLGWLGSPM